MVLLEAWKVVVGQRYAQFDGRAGRPEFWWFVLASWIISFVLNVLGRASGFFTVIGVIYSLAILVPSLAVAVRRLHDTDRSGWWLLLWLIPIVGWIILILFLAAATKPGANKHGIAAPPFPQLTAT